ncbi:MAG: cyclic nucleotide-binding domain-containing protein [Candidatus Heimdallarchaeota archaeon]|nr:cyclic nucleotide-binding domain-containing protein [Candidatus Heimdallarchaeota archaeon]
MKEDSIETISIKAARNLTHTAKTRPMMVAQSPKLLTKLLSWKEVPGGTLRINRTKLIFKGTGLIPIEFGDGGVPVVTPDALKQVPLFYNLDGKIISKMVENLKIEQFAIDTELIAEGEDRDKMYILASGKAEMTKIGKHEEMLRLKVIGPGEFFGEDELVADKEADFTITTLTETTFLTLSVTDLKSILSSSKKLKADFDTAIEEAMRIKELTDDFGEHRVELKAGHMGVEELPLTYIDYIEEPVEIPMNVIQTVLKVHTRVSDLYNNPINQLQMQLQTTMQYMYEKQEWMLINDPHFGLLANCHPSMRIQPRYGSPTPDDLDALLSLAWKQPSFFLAHPRTIAAFERECTWRGTPPPHVTIMGQTVITWRGIPLIPSDKVEVNGQTVSRHGPGKSSIILIRAGDEDIQGVTGLYQVGIPGEVAPGFSVRMMSIDNKAIASYLMTLYFSLAILTEDAVAVLENVEVGYYHDYTARKPKLK